MMVDRAQKDDPVQNALSTRKKGEINKRILLSLLPEMHRIDVKKYLRGFVDIAPDFVQKSREDAVLVTKEDVIRSIEPDIHLCHRHVVLVGPEGAGKSTVIERIYDTLRVQIMRYMVFLIDLWHFSGEEVMSVNQFLWHKRGNVVDENPGSIENIFGMMASKSPRVLILLNGLDMIPCQFEPGCERIHEDSKAPTRVILHNILAGKIYPNAKILTTCRDHRVRDLKGKLCPDEIISVGELSEHTVKSITRAIIGQAHFQDVLDIWEKQSQSLCLLNRTASYLMYNILAATTGESFRYERTMPMAMFNLLLSCITQCSERSDKKRVLEIIWKIKRLAYYGTRRNKYSFEEKDVLARFNLSTKEMDKVCSRMASASDATYYPVSVRFNAVVFLDTHNQEFLCAMNVSDLPIQEYKAFLKDCIHLPRYHIVRRMVCSLLLDPNANRPARRESLIEEQDMELRKDLLVSSMKAEFHNVKRRELLHFFHAVRDCGEGGRGILPKKVDAIDMSHIKLHLLDMQAVGASIAGNIRIGYLNFANTDLTLNGLSVFRSRIKSSKTKIYGFNLDWCDDWTKYTPGVEILCDIVKKCEVKDLSLNHTKMFAACLHMVDVGLGAAKIKNFHLEEEKNLSDQGYAILGDFIIRHEVENLYITAKDVTPKQMKKLAYGLREFKVKDKMPMWDSTMYVGRLDVESD